MLGLRSGSGRRRARPGGAGAPARIAVTINAYARPELGPPRHRLFAIEYFNPAPQGRHEGRFFKKPDAKDLEKVRSGRPALAVADARIRARTRRSCPATRPTACTAGVTGTTASCSTSASCSGWS